MDPQYIANVYYQKEKIATKSGDDIEELHIWMIVQLDEYGDGHGEFIDLKTNEVVKTFCKSCPY